MRLLSPRAIATPRTDAAAGSAEKHAILKFEVLIVFNLDPRLILPDMPDIEDIDSISRSGVVDYIVRNDKTPDSVDRTSVVRPTQLRIRQKIAKTLIDLMAKSRAHGEIARPRIGYIS